MSIRLLKTIDDLHGALRNSIDICESALLEINKLRAENNLDIQRSSARINEIRDAIVSGEDK